MISDAEVPRNLAALSVPLAGELVVTGEVFDPFRLVDPDGLVVAPVAVFLRDLGARGRSVATQRSYALACLRWFRFLWAIGVPWDEATRAEARDFSCWLQTADRPRRCHWRHPDSAPLPALAAGPPSPVTGKPGRGAKYAASTVAHCETVVRGFYDLHLDMGTGPMVNPFPLSRDRGRGRPGAHHNPMEPYHGARSGRYRPRVRARVSAADSG